MADSTIEWTDATWNPVAGCSIVTAGCTNCYAMRMAARLDAMGHQKYRGLTRRSGRRYVWTGRVHLDLAALGAPATWRKPRRVFVNSMSDLFHPAVPATFVGKVWDTMADNRQHTYQILTKRPERATAIVADFPVLPNVWLGTSVESEKCSTAWTSCGARMSRSVLSPSSPCSVPLRLQISSAFIGRSLAARADRARARWFQHGWTK